MLHLITVKMPETAASFLGGFPMRLSFQLFLDIILCIGSNVTLLCYVLSVVCGCLVVMWTVFTIYLVFTRCLMFNYDYNIAVHII